MNSPEYFIKLSKNQHRITNLLEKIEQKGFDILETSDYIALIKLYMGKILSESKNIEKTFKELTSILDTYHLDINNYTNNNYTTVHGKSKAVAKKIIRIYKNKEYNTND